MNAERDLTDAETGFQHDDLLDAQHDDLLDRERDLEREAIRAEACGEDLEPDVEQARAFIAALTGDPEALMTWQTFDDSDLKRGDLGRVLHGTVKELFPQLVARNRRGAGIFLMVNAGDSKGPRKAENVVALRALFTDHDAPGSPVSPLPPSFTCSGRAYGHRYWRLKPGEPLGRFAGAQKALAAYYHSDAAVHDLARVMRVPGFFNQKHGGRFPVRFEPGSGHVYTIDEVLAAHPVADTRTTATVRTTTSAKLRVGPGQRHATLTHFAAQMRRDGLAGRPIHAALRALADESFDLSDGRTVPDSEIADVVAWIDQREGDPLPEFHSLEQPQPDTWPELDQAALYGLAGDVVRAIEPHTEADRVAVLTHFLVMFGNAAGPTPYFTVGAEYHNARLFAVIIAGTSTGKGISAAYPRRIFKKAVPEWAKDCISGGLSTGEGLIAAVRDPEPPKEGQPPPPPPPDRRLLVLETEFARLIRVMRRPENILSTVVRQAWDSPDLNVKTRKDPLRATGTHISIVGHITPEELLGHMEGNDAASGFANRFLWIKARQSKLLPDGGHVPDRELEGLSNRVEKALASARVLPPERARDHQAAELWRTRYPALRENRHGIYGHIVARGHAQAARIALVYALIDESPQIRLPHLKAALALWEYAAASARQTFGDLLGDPIADRIIRELRATPEGLSRADVVDLFSRNAGAARIENALSTLESLKLARRERVSTGGRGRPTERWYAL